MAAPSKPKPKSSKGVPPTAPTTVVGNHTAKPEAGALVPLNFKVDGEFRKELKAFAVAHDMSMVDVLREAFAMYKTSKGGS